MKIKNPLGRKIINRIIILMTVFTKRVIAVLDMPADIDDFITFANAIHNSMTGSTYFAGLAAKLATLLSNIGHLVTANNATKTTPPTVTVAARDIELNKVIAGLHSLQMDVQGLADLAATDIAEDIITSAGMKVKKQGTINKQDLEVKDGEISGTVTAVAKGAETSRAAHDWGVTKDNEVTWLPVTPTLAATTVISDIIEMGDTIKVRHRYILTEGPTDFIVSESFLVR